MAFHLSNYKYMYLVIFLSLYMNCDTNITQQINLDLINGKRILTEDIKNEPC